ncbi:MAG: hypothetical protein JXQ96_00965 [Cyclobacteriaceae bacterium]
MALKSLKYLMPVIMLFVTGFSIYGQYEPILIWKNQKAIGVSLPNSISDPVIKVKGQSATISGKYSESEDRIIFYPIWPFGQAIRYEVWEHGKIVYSFELPKRVNVLPATVEVYPKLDTLPENLLKFYLVFSQPMAVGNVYEHISILDENGQVLPRTFLQLEPELWNRDNTILTLWIDPGRIKRDLVLNKMLGSPLREGQDYGIKISGKWKSAHGKELGEDVLLSFTSSTADRKSPNVDAWKFILPKNKSIDPLVIVFDEVLDYVLSGECIFLERDNEEIKGSTEVLQNKKQWTFTPSTSWKVGEYQIKVETRLEDLAGNNLNRLFDVDLTERAPSASSDKVIVSRTLTIVE